MLDWLCPFEYLKVCGFTCKCHVKMANLKSSLDSYLARSSDSLQSSSTTSSTKNWFSFSRPEREEQIPVEGENGWFPQAQEDPCLPSLVRNNNNANKLSLLTGMVKVYVTVSTFIRDWVRHDSLRCESPH